MLGTAKRQVPTPVQLTPEQLAVRDAIPRFAKMMKAEKLEIAKEDYRGGPLPEIEGCELVLITRDELVTRHVGQKAAPIIMAITIYRAGTDPNTPFTVLLALECAAIMGFDEYPDGVGHAYIYQPTANGVEFVKEQGWVE